MDEVIELENQLVKKTNIRTRSFRKGEMRVSRTLLGVNLIAESLRERHKMKPKSKKRKGRRRNRNRSRSRDRLDT